MAAPGAELTARPEFAPEPRGRPFPWFSAGFLSVDKSVVRPIAHSHRGGWRLSTWYAVPTGVGAGGRFATERAELPTKGKSAIRGRRPECRSAPKFVRFRSYKHNVINCPVGSYQ
jgi:hypothetical protein